MADLCNLSFPGWLVDCGDAVWLTDVADGRVNDSSSLDHDREHIDSAASVADSSGGGDGPFVVVYMVDSFTYGTQAGDGEDAAASRLATVGLLQCYSSMLKAIPDHLHSSIQLQVYMMSAECHSAVDLQGFPLPSSRCRLSCDYCLKDRG